jgi:hypothetical protein
MLSLSFTAIKSKLFHDKFQLSVLRTFNAHNRAWGGGCCRLMAPEKESFTSQLFLGANPICIFALIASRPAAYLRLHAQPFDVLVMLLLLSRVH